jgi:uncharacterized RDD family membrane protein YckC
MPPGGGFSAAGPVSPAGQPLATAGMRILARLLDGIVLSVVFGAIFASIILSGDDSAGFGGLGADASFGKVYTLALLGVAVGFVWDAVLTKMFGGTPMKLALGMKVVRADNGGPVEWSHAIIRWAIPGAFSLIPIPVLPGLANLVIVIVSLVFIFTKPTRQAVWDMIAKTLVVKSR